MNRALLGTVREEAPDVMFAVQLHYEIWLETLDAIRSIGEVTTVCWNTDDSWKYREVSRFIGRSYHVMATTYGDKIDCYHRDGIPHVLLTQWAANAEALAEPIPAEDCRIQVSFIGFAHGNRKRSVEKLRKMGVDVTCFGHGWPVGPVEAGDMPGIMRQSVISLNFANAKGQNQIKARTFEVPGSGGFLLTEYAPGLENYYALAKEIAVFHNLEELAHQVGYYLSHPRERDAMAHAGHHRTREDHTYEARLAQVLATATAMHDGGPGAGGDHRAAPFDEAYDSHGIAFPLKLLRTALVVPCVAVWGRTRGRRAARRILFEMSWRVFRRKTFTAAGLPARLFPDL